MVFWAGAVRILAAHGYGDGRMVSVQGYSKSLARIAAVLMIGAGLSACSSVPDWVDPTTWVGGDDSTASNELPPDQSADADQSGDQSTDQGANADDQQQGLAYIPDRPAASSTQDEQANVSDSLKADRAKAKYSSDNLRGDVAQSTAPIAAPAPTAPASDAGGTATASVAPAAAPTAQVAMGSTSHAPVVTSDSTGPAVPPLAGPAAPGQSPSDAALGFRPSKAPPLDSSVAQFVAPPIMSRFQQTASTSTAAVGGQAAVPAVPAGPAMGGPEMSGAVVANLDALQSTPGAEQASTFANPAGLPPAAVVFFPHDTTILSAAGREQVHAAVAAYMSKGGAGYIRVVGHSSSRTANMPLARHLVFNFERSQARATAVAKELIREGVPAAKVLVEAVGDSQPVYYESMPQGEEGNRRAEIFIQS